MLVDQILRHRRGYIDQANPRIGITALIREVGQVDDLKTGPVLEAAIQAPIHDVTGHRRVVVSGGNQEPEKTVQHLMGQGFTDESTDNPQKI